MSEVAVWKWFYLIYHYNHRLMEKEQSWGMNIVSQIYLGIYSLQSNFKNIHLF